MRFPWLSRSEHCQTDPGHVLAAINAGDALTIRRIEVDLGADGGQALRVSFERQTLLDQLFAQIGRHEGVVGMVGGAGHLICEADILIAPGEQPEIISLTVMLLPEDAAQEGAFRRELTQVWCVESAAENLLNVLVLFDDDDDVIVQRQHRWPSEPLGSRGRGACSYGKRESADDLSHDFYSGDARIKRVLLILAGNVVVVQAPG
jgi:hypothetical protein